MSYEMKYSIIIPVYNRPDECAELLQSLAAQQFTREPIPYEVLVVEDGSSVPAKAVCAQYEGKLAIRYFVKPNEGPAAARNYAAARAKGEYLLILDSDAVLPSGYLQAVDDELRAKPCDAFGGPDRAHASFTPMQKAINYAMTSFFTTGGIRGGRKGLDKFYPRSFNMGCRADVFQRLGGFSAMRFGEDIDFSTRVFAGGYACRLFPEAWVWHKRRTDLRKFFRQVYNSGIARINLSLRHPGTLKAVHVLPAVFAAGCITLVLLAALGVALGCAYALWCLLPLLLFSLIIFSDAMFQEQSVGVGLRAVAAAFVQLMGYGLGFLHAVWRRLVLHGGEFAAFQKNFYK